VYKHRTKRFCVYGKDVSKRNLKHDCVSYTKYESTQCGDRDMWNGYASNYILVRQESH